MTESPSQINKRKKAINSITQSFKSQMSAYKKAIKSKYQTQLRALVRRNHDKLNHPYSIYGFKAPNITYIIPSSVKSTSRLNISRKLPQLAYSLIPSTQKTIDSYKSLNRRFSAFEHYISNSLIPSILDAFNYNIRLALNALYKILNTYGGLNLVLLPTADSISSYNFNNVDKTKFEPLIEIVTYLKMTGEM